MVAIRFAPTTVFKQTGVTARRASAFKPMAAKPQSAGVSAEGPS
jgi:hypothetical protein